MLDTDRLLAVAMLRTAGFSANSVADLLGCVEKTVRRDEDRLRMTLPDSDLVALVSETAMTEVIDSYLPGLSDVGLNEEELGLLRRVTADKILLHYERTRALEMAEIDRPRRSRLLGRHQSKMARLARTLAGQIRPPDSEALFSIDICRQIHTEAESSRLKPAIRWRQPFDGPLRFAAGEEEGVPFSRTWFVIEEAREFRYLAAHLAEEPPLLADLDEWRQDVVTIANSSLAMALEATRECWFATGIEYVGGRRSFGLEWRFPAYICRHLFEHPDEAGPPPVQVTETADYCRLHAGDTTVEWLAEADSIQTIRTVESALASICRELRLRGDWPGLAGRHHQLVAKSDELRDRLGLIAERRQFNGTCAVCEKYYG